MKNKKSLGDKTRGTTEEMMKGTKCTGTNNEKPIRSRAK
ncbi:unnamed protein product [Heterotrigona itama]|uniref:Uncharacterized protein n=1 Tax=Heterotrigona itama TaxID=395501 RepID=A0A6V7HHP3_9HYME|nr:unnamed protein product [Heterotrigona itama]